jgi:protein ImuA
MADPLHIPLPDPRAAALRALRVKLAASGRVAGTLPLGVAALDAALPGGGLGLGALHELAGAGVQTEAAAAATLFLAGVLARLCRAVPGPVLWVMPQRDLFGVFAPGLAGAGLDPERVIYAEVPRPADVLQALEDALRHRGMAGVAGDLAGPLSLTASRRLQLAAEQAGLPCFLLRRSRKHDDPALAAPSAAATRWRVQALPSPPPLPGQQVPGLGRQRWQVSLLRCRGGGRPGCWELEAFDAQGRLGVPGAFVHGPAAPDRRAAGERAVPGRAA